MEASSMDRKMLRFYLTHDVHTASDMESVQRVARSDRDFFTRTVFECVREVRPHVFKIVLQTLQGEEARNFIEVVSGDSSRRASDIVFLYHCPVSTEDKIEILRRLLARKDGEGLVQSYLLAQIR